MTEREKVIESLQEAAAYFRSSFDAMYGTVACEKFMEWTDAIEKAIALLKAQEPRVMTLYEVAKMAADFNDCMLWFEPKEVDDDMWFMAYAQPVEGDETYINIYEFGNDVPIEAKKYLYGKTWRCWTSCPDEKRRAETPWN